MLNPLVPLGFLVFHIQKIF
uniref:Uncharacterized protein n=1 Tax=Anguilla anguilla TaxID=7936 RepID=A0A0E9QPU6_ANGAN